MIQDNEVFVIDDFIEKEYQEQIKKVLLGSEPNLMTKSFLGILLKMLQHHMMMIVNIETCINESSVC